MFNSMTRRFPWGVFFALLLVMFVESGLARHDLELTRPEGTNLRMAQLSARKRAKGCDVLFLGSSMVHSGVLPAVVDQFAGTKSYNLAVVAGTTSTSYYLLKQALESGARPSAVVLDVHPAFILQDNRDRNHFWADSIGWTDLADLSWTLRDAHIFSEVALKKSLRSLYHRDQLRIGVQDALNGGGTTHWATNLGMMRNHNQNQGAFIGVSNPAYHGEVTPLYKGMWVHEGHRIGSAPSAELYMHRFMQLAESHGIRVYWLNMPLVPDLERDRELAGLNAAYDNFTKKFLVYSNLVILDARRSGYEPAVFMDATHLAPDGSYALSRGIASVLCRQLVPGELKDADLQVAIPKYRDRTIDIPGEDMRASALEIMKPGSLRR